MKRIFTPALALLLSVTLSAHSQSDSIRYKPYMGTYTITTTSFPVNEVIIYWQDSVLAFKAGAMHGNFKPIRTGEFSFQVDDHSGTVTFKEGKSPKDSDITIVMDGETYIGNKKP